MDANEALALLLDECDHYLEPLAIVRAEVERLQAIERRLRDAALNEIGPRGLWAAQMIAIRSSSEDEA